MASLTPKQQRFVQEYLVDLNAAAAARRTGYCVRTSAEAAKAGWRLLQHEAVREAVREAMLERQKRTELSADYVLSNLREIVERSMQRAPVLTRRGEQLTDAQGRHVWRFDGRTASRALELLGRHLGMFAERVRPERGGAISVSWEEESAAPSASEKGAETGAVSAQVGSGGRNAAENVSEAAEEGGSAPGD